MSRLIGRQRLPFYVQFPCKFLLCHVPAQPVVFYPFADVHMISLILSLLIPRHFCFIYYTIGFAVIEMSILPHVILSFIAKSAGERTDHVPSHRRIS